MEFRRLNLLLLPYAASLGLSGCSKEVATAERRKPVPRAGISAIDKASTISPSDIVTDIQDQSKDAEGAGGSSQLSAIPFAGNIPSSVIGSGALSASSVLFLGSDGNSWKYDATANSVTKLPLEGKVTDGFTRLTVASKHYWEYSDAKITLGEPASDAPDAAISRASIGFSTLSISGKPKLLSATPTYLLLAVGPDLVHVKDTSTRFSVELVAWPAEFGEAISGGEIEGNSGLWIASSTGNHLLTGAEAAQWTSFPKNWTDPPEKAAIVSLAGWTDKTSQPPTNWLISTSGAIFSATKVDAPKEIAP